MKKISFLKKILPILLIVIGFGFSADAQTKGGDFPIVTLADNATANQNITQEIVSLKTSLQTLTPGSAEYVDGMRRIKVFAAVSKTLENGESVAQAIQAGRTTLFEKIEYKEDELPELNNILKDMMTFLTN